MKKEINKNIWDAEIVPSFRLNEYKGNRGLRFFRNEKRIIGQLSRKRKDISPIHLAIKRSLQLAYIEPFFQTMLQPNLKGKLFIHTIGRYYWVIGATKAIYATHFRFYEKVIRKALENHLNTVSRKKWHVPPFRVRIIPTEYQNKAYYEELKILQQKRIYPIVPNRLLKKNKSSDNGKEERENIYKTKVAADKKSNRFASLITWLYEEEKRQQVKRAIEKEEWRRQS